MTKLIKFYKCVYCKRKYKTFSEHIFKHFHKKHPNQSIKLDKILNHNQEKPLNQ